MSLSTYEQDFVLKLKYSITDFLQLYDNWRKSGSTLSFDQEDTESLLEQMLGLATDIEQIAN